MVTWYIGDEMNYSIRYQNIVTNLLISKGAPPGLGHLVVKYSSDEISRISKRWFLPFTNCHHGEFESFFDGFSMNLIWQIGKTDKATNHFQPTTLKIFIKKIFYDISKASYFTLIIDYNFYTLFSTENVQKSLFSGENSPEKFLRGKLW